MVKKKYLKLGLVALVVFLIVLIAFFLYSSSAGSSIPEMKIPEGVSKDYMEITLDSNGFSKERIEVESGKMFFLTIANKGSSPQVVDLFLNSCSSGALESTPWDETDYSLREHITIEGNKSYNTMFPHYTKNGEDPLPARFLFECITCNNSKYLVVDLK